MKFEPLPLQGAWLISLAPIEDHRGYYARAWCRKEFEDHGVDPEFVQVNTVFSKSKGTLRGMHYQCAPALEPKFIRCLRGSFYDVIVDMRPDSPTYRQHYGVEISADNHKMLYMPGMFGHGFLTLEDDTEASYMVGGYYAPECGRGFRHDDPAIGIEWPIPVEVLSDKDRAWPDLEPV